MDYKPSLTKPIHQLYTYRENKVVSSCATKKKKKGIVDENFTKPGGKIMYACAQQHQENTERRPVSKFNSGLVVNPAAATSAFFFFILFDMT